MATAGPLLTLACLALMIIGLIRPSLVLPSFLQPTRPLAAAVYGILAFGCLGIFAASLPPQPKQPTAVAPAMTEARPSRPPVVDAPAAQPAIDDVIADLVAIDGKLTNEATFRDLLSALGQRFPDRTARELADMAAATKMGCAEEFGKTIPVVAGLYVLRNATQGLPAKQVAELDPGELLVMWAGSSHCNIRE